MFLICVDAAIFFFFTFISVSIYFLNGSADSIRRSDSKERFAQTSSYIPLLRYGEKLQ